MKKIYIFLLMIIYFCFIPGGVDAEVLSSQELEKYNVVSDIISLGRNNVYYLAQIDNEEGKQVADLLKKNVSTGQTKKLVRFSKDIVIRKSGFEDENWAYPGLNTLFKFDGSLYILGLDTLYKISPHSGEKMLLLNTEIADNGYRFTDHVQQYNRLYLLAENDENNHYLIMTNGKKWFKQKQKFARTYNNLRFKKINKKVYVYTRNHPLRILSLKSRTKIGRLRGYRTKLSKTVADTTTLGDFAYAVKGYSKLKRFSFKKRKWELVTKQKMRGDIVSSRKVLLAPLDPEYGRGWFTTDGRNRHVHFLPEKWANYRISSIDSNKSGVSVLLKKLGQDSIRLVSRNGVDWYYLLNAEKVFYLKGNQLISKNSTVDIRYLPVAELISKQVSK